MSHPADTPVCVPEKLRPRVSLVRAERAITTEIIPFLMMTINVLQVNALIARDPPLLVSDPVRAVERVHFYLIYRGGNNRVIQEKIARCGIGTFGMLMYT